MSIMAATSSFVQFTFIGFFCFAVVGTDASVAEAILSSSELVTRLRSRLAIPGYIAPGSVTVVAYRFERFRV